MLSKYKRNRFNASPFCCICGEYIFSDEEVMYVTRKSGRCKTYEFFHPSCMIKKARRCTLGQEEKEGNKEET